VTNTALLAETLVAAGCFVIFLSTNAVFDGEIPRRRTCDPVSPRTEYGRQKAESERRILELGDSACVLRITKVFPRNPPLFMGWKSRLRQGQPIHPFHDLTCAPLELDILIRVLMSLSELRYPGIWQLSGDRDISYGEIANHIASSIHADPNLVQSVSIRSSPFYQEHVPCYTSLDCSRLNAEMGVETPNAWKTLDTVLNT
jgi:dTDP-4-dehydrorhamnose reductase